MKNSALLSLAAVTLLLAACGTSTTDRTLSGAGLGAAGGAAIGGLAGGSAVNGALIGAVAGGATGALTDSSDVNLGKPAWR